MSLTINGTSPDSIVYNGTQVYKVIYNGVEVWKKSFPFTLNLTLEYALYEDRAWQGCIWYNAYTLLIRISSVSATGSTSSFQSIKLASFKIQGYTDGEPGRIFSGSPDIEILGTSQSVNGDDTYYDKKYWDYIFYSDEQEQKQEQVRVLDVSITLHLVATLVDGTEVPVTISYSYTYDSSFTAGDPFPINNKTLTFNRSVQPE